MSADCPDCKGRPFAACDGCGAHYMPESPTGRCFDCRQEMP